MKLQQLYLLGCSLPTINEWRYLHNSTWMKKACTTQIFYICKSFRMRQSSKGQRKNSVNAGKLLFNSFRFQLSAEPDNWGDLFLPTSIIQAIGWQKICIPYNSTCPRCLWCRRLSSPSQWTQRTIFFQKTQILSQISKALLVFSQRHVN